MPPTNNINWTFLVKWSIRFFMPRSRTEATRDTRDEVALAMLEFLETGWEQPDDGIWEMRGPRRHFVHSKMMAWVAVDRPLRSAERGW